MSIVMEATKTLVTLSPAEAKARLDGGELAVIDVRTEVEYASVHARGVTHVPLDRFSASDVMKRFEGKTIACICKGGTRGAKAAQLLLEAGCENVANIAGGTQAWEAAGLPVEKLSNVLPLERQVLLVAGGLVVAGVALAQLVNPWFIVLSAFVGCGLMFAGLSGFCGMAMLLAKMPWNRNLSSKSSCCGGGSCAA